MLHTLQIYNMRGKNKNKSLFYIQLVDVNIQICDTGLLSMTIPFLLDLLLHNLR